MCEDFYSWTVQTKSPGNYSIFLLRKYRLTLRSSRVNNVTPTTNKNKSPSKYEPVTLVLNPCVSSRRPDSKSTKARARRKKQNLGKEEEKRRKGDIWRGNSRVPAEKMRPTIWPVLGTIASYYAHNKRQWGHAKVTLPARLAPLLPAQKGLTAGCTMHDRHGRASETEEASPLSPCSHTHQQRTRARTRATPLTAAHAHKGHERRRLRTRVPLARGGDVFRLPSQAWESSHVSRSTSQQCTSVRRNFGGRTYTHSAGLDEDGGASCRVRARFGMGARQSDPPTVFAARMEKRETMNAVRKRFVYQHVPN